MIEAATTTLALYNPQQERALCIKPFSAQLLKWIGNKQRQAPEIISFFPKKYGLYIEPFLGSGGVLGTLAPQRAIAGDIFLPLMDIWKTLKKDKDLLIHWYEERFALIQEMGKVQAYKKVLSAYNKNPSAADFIFLIRSCYGGVVRFRKSDGYMSTPCGAHDPISPTSFSKRVAIWHQRASGTEFVVGDFSDTMDLAKSGDLIYCDPPYIDSQTILYGAQNFKIEKLFAKIQECKERGVFVSLSIDGIKKSGTKLCPISPPPGLFKRELFINTGRSMLKRFQMNGKTLEKHVVHDRLYLTY